MANSKTTKRALCSSVLAVVLCIAMLVGTTFAWFTDTASTSVNKIQAGNLDVGLEMLVNNEWVDAEGQTLNFKAADNRTDILWEPGCTYELPTLRVVNKGNLALKYCVTISGINGDAKLNEAIEWKVTTPVGDWGTLSGVTMAPGYNSWEGKPILSGDEEGCILKIAGHMKEDAGNEYQGLSIDGIAITVTATQYTYEKDINGDQYDANAAFPNVSVWDGTVADTFEAESDGIYHIETAAQLAAFAADVNSGNTYAGKTVVLDADMNLNNYKWIPIGLYARPIGGGSLMCISFQGTFDGQGHTISNMRTSDTFATDTLDIVAAPALFGSTDNGAVIKNLTIKDALVFGFAQYSYSAAVVGSHSSGDLTISNVAVEGTTICASRYPGGFVGIASRSTENPGKVTLDKCSMNDVELCYVHSFGANNNVVGDDWNSNAVVNGVDKVTETNVTVVNDKDLFYSYKDEVEK